MLSPLGKELKVASRFDHHQFGSRHVDSQMGIQQRVIHAEATVIEQHNSHGSAFNQRRPPEITNAAPGNVVALLTFMNRNVGRHILGKGHHAPGHFHRAAEDGIKLPADVQRHSGRDAGIEGDRNRGGIDNRHE